MNGRLSLKYKGNRDYLHGTDLFDHICQHMVTQFKRTELSQVDMTIYRMMRSQLTFELFTDRKPTKPIAVAAQFRFVVDRTQYTCLLQEDGRAVSGRYPYDEEQVKDLCILNNEEQAVTLVERIPHTNIETVVAMNKVLLKKCFPEVEGKWLFTRISLAAYDMREQWDGLSLKVLHNFQQRSVRSEIRNNGTLKGSIFFSARRN